MNSFAPTMKELALKFVRNIKQGFNNPEDEENNKYNQFASALDDFFQGRISAEGLVVIMESLFEGHQNLLTEFKIFLPKNDQETKSVTNYCENEGISSTKSVQQACNEFTRKVKDRFKDKFEVYTSYLEITIQYGKGMLNICEVYEKAYELFFGHADLICEFESFLTDQDEKVRLEIEKIRVFIFEDRLLEVDIRLTNLQSIIAIMEAKLLYGGLDDDVVACIKKLYGDYLGLGEEGSSSRNDHTPGVSCLYLPRLKQKETENFRIKDSYLNFVKECHRLRSRLR